MKAQTCIAQAGNAKSFMAQRGEYGDVSQFTPGLFFHTLEAYSPLLGCKRFDLNTNKLAILSPAEKCRRPSDRTSWELVRWVLVSSPPTGCHGLSHAPQLDRHLRPERWRRLCELSGGAAGQWSACQACEMEARPPRVKNERWTKSGEAWEKGGGAP